MERAISKNETRVEQARLALEDAKNNQKQDSADTPSVSKTATIESHVSPGTSAEPPTTEKSVDELQAIYEKAQAKQEKLQNTLADLPEDDPAREKMIRAISKNEGRVIQAKQEWQAAQSATATLPIEIEQLEQNVEKARHKLDNMKSSLEDAKAHQPELVEKLQRAVQKNEMRLSAAEQALEDARRNSSTTAKDDTSPSTKPTHDRGF